MDRITVRLPPDLIRRFDAAAAGQGGRSRLLRRLVEDAARVGNPVPVVPGAGGRSAKLTVRLSRDDLDTLEREAARVGLSRTQWTVALIRRRLHERPQFGPADAVTLIAIRRELRRIGVNVNQIARALNTAVLEGSVLDLETAQLAAFAEEIRAHVQALGEAFEGNLAYWSSGS
ncbi:MAG: plasmid mobilization relaxosome protein MobC [Brevundimonas sp.]